MDDFFHKQNYQLSDLQYLIDNQIAENFMLDYKSGKLFTNKSDKEIKEAIIEHITSIANNKGGIVIYGLEEDSKKIIPTAYSYIDFLKFTKESMDNIIKDNISDTIEDLVIYPIPNPNNHEEGVYLIKIPRSYNSPHMALDGKYHIRVNTTSREMKDSEVKNKYETNRTPQLDFGAITVDGFNFEIQSRAPAISLTFYLKINIVNVGKMLERNYKLCLYISNSYTSELDVFRSDNGFTTEISQGTRRYCKTGLIPLFQGEEVEFASFRLNITKDRYLCKAYNNIGIILLSSSGKKEMFFDILKQDVGYKNSIYNFNQ